MTQEEIKKIKDRAVEASSRVPMVDVLHHCGYYGKIKKRGNNIFFECPTGCESDGSMSRCSINQEKNLAYCFSCKKGWGPAALAAEYMNMHYIEAALYLAKGAGAITDEEYDNCTYSAVRRNKLMSDNTTFKLIEVKKAKEYGEYKAPAEVVDVVYRHMLRLPEFSLTKKAYDYLRNERNISDEDIKKSMFFSYERFFSIDKLIENIRKDVPGFTYKNLVGVPGFYFVFTDKEKKMGKWKFRNPLKNCIGIPLMDCDKRIVALQMRFNEDKQQYNGTRYTNKYFFITSTSVKNGDKEGYGIAYGSSPGTPAHVEYPDIVTNPAFLIGEGKFKMMEAAKEGSVSFSCQGVGNYTYVVEEIGKCIKSKTLRYLMSDQLVEKKAELSFIIMYDSDIFRNYAVLTAGCDLAKTLIRKYKKTPYFLFWDEKYGKGYDDMKHYFSSKRLNYKDYCFLMDGNEFIKMALDSLKFADSKYERSLKYESLYSKCLYNSLWVGKVKPIYDKKVKIVNSNHYKLA